MSKQDHCYKNEYSLEPGKKNKLQKADTQKMIY